MNEHNEPRPTKRAAPDRGNASPDQRNEPQFSRYQVSEHKMLSTPTGETTKYCVLKFYGWQ